jgi:hypothetical protein
MVQMKEGQNETKKMVFQKEMTGSDYCYEQKWGKWGGGLMSPLKK